GLLAHSDREERFLNSQSELEARVEIALGGLAAEEVFFGEISSGPAGDLKTATYVTALMVGSLGMDGSLFSYEAMQMPSSANIVAKVASSDEGKARIEERLSAARLRVRDMLAENRHVVEALRDALLDRHELIGDEILDVIHAAIASERPQERDLRP